MILWGLKMCSLDYESISNINFLSLRKYFKKITCLQNKIYEKEQRESIERITLEEKSKEFEIDESFLIDERVYYEPNLLIYEPSEEIKEAEENLLDLRY